MKGSRTSMHDIRTSFPGPLLLGSGHLNETKKKGAAGLTNPSSELRDDWGR